jgi:hypothetical protein
MPDVLIYKEVEAGLNSATFYVFSNSNNGAVWWVVTALHASTASHAGSGVSLAFLLLLECSAAVTEASAASSHLGCAGLSCSSSLQSRQHAAAVAKAGALLRVCVQLQRCIGCCWACC